MNVSVTSALRRPGGHYIAAVVLVCAVVADIIVAQADPVASLVLATLPLVPLALFAVAKVITDRRSRHYIQGTLPSIVLIVLLTATFRYRRYEEKDIDFQVVLRLVSIAALCAVSAVSLRRIIRNVRRAGFVSWMLFFGYLILSSSYAVSPTSAFVSVLSLLVVFLFICHLCVCFGPDRAVGVITTTSAVLCVGSLATYLAMPALGRMSDWVGGDFVETWRLQGMFGSSNGAGMAAAAGLYLAVAFGSPKYGCSRPLAITAAMSALVCLVLSNNRMALFALMIAAATFYVLKGAFARKVVFIVAIVLLGVSAVTLLSDHILSIVSRSGSAEEIMSATGRTRIWATVIDMWLQTPLFGRGFGSALYLLPVHPDLFLAAAHAHNLYLEQLFSGGLIGLGLFLGGIAITMVAAFRAGASRELALLVFFLVYGFTEPVISGPVSFPLVIMFLSIAKSLSPAPPTLFGARLDEASGGGASSTTTSTSYCPISGRTSGGPGPAG